MRKQFQHKQTFRRKVTPTRLTRRAFLRASALTTLGTVSSTWLTSCSPDTSARPTPSPIATQTTELVVSAGLGVNIHPSAHIHEDIAALATLGLRVVRMDMSWDQIERRQGHYDFSRYDPVIDALGTYGIRPLCILGYNNTLYERTTAPQNYVVGPRTDEVRQAFARFAAAAASHFQGRGIAWEVWNEPDYTLFWYPTPLADDYMALARPTIQAIRRADPQATIVAPALIGLEPRYLTSWTFLERCLALGLADLIDVLSVHPYRLDAPESVTADYQRLRALLARQAPRHGNLPLISSEWGYSSWISQEQQAAYFVRLNLLNLLNNLPMSIWYDWRDDDSDPQQVNNNFGLLSSTGQPKPVYHAARTLLTELSGFSLVKRVALPIDTDYALLFSNGTVSKQVLWTATSPHTITLTANTPTVRLTSATGEAHSQPTTRGRLAIALTGTPQYFALTS